MYWVFGLLNGGVPTVIYVTGGPTVTRYMKEQASWGMDEPGEALDRLAESVCEWLFSGTGMEPSYYAECRAVIRTMLSVEMQAGKMWILNADMVTERLNKKAS